MKESIRISLSVKSGKAVQRVFHEGRRHESTGGGSDGFRVMMLVMI